MLKRLKKFPEYLHSGYAPKWLIIAYYGGALLLLALSAIGCVLALKHAIHDAQENGWLLTLLWGVLGACFIVIGGVWSIERPEE